jgi:hypothetical protein
MRLLEFSIDPKLPADYTALGSTYLLTEISTMILPRGKGPPARKSDSLTAMCEPTV